MGITLFTLGGLLAPLQSLMAWIAPAPRRHLVTMHTRPAAVRAPALRTHCVRPVALPTRREVLRRPLRVVRVVENANTQAGAGRMFMSGRMADVCAELDRLAALEAAAG
ncbi:MAG: hypothetical protein JWQ07_1767 [Ramlibacter sp.]|nr:hypothetical protein [Ramlibacter sp.]